MASRAFQYFARERAVLSFAAAIWASKARGLTTTAIGASLRPRSVSRFVMVGTAPFASDFSRSMARFSISSWPVNSSTGPERR
jgi:hypothetical protein